MVKSKVKTKEGDEDIIAYDINEFTPNMLLFKDIQRNHKFISFATDYMVLDTETSHINDEDSWVYQWAVKFQDQYIYGRTPSEIIDLLKKLCEYYGLNEKKKIICYIHNASYDIQYLKHFLKRYDPFINILAIDNHTILQVDVFGFRFLCSYKLTNMGLNKLSESYSKKYIKAVGEIDYNVVRFQDQELSAADWYYMFSDVASQHDAINGYIHSMGYNYAYECPITSTGFVRVKCRRASFNDPDWRQQFEMSALNIDDYLLCRQCFMGGVTIQSFVYAGITIRSDKLKHKDYTSSYPARQMLDYMPVGQPMRYSVKSAEEFEKVLNMYCCIFVIELKDVHIKSGITAPYIPSSKCFDYDELLKINGKVVFAKHLKIALCEVDWQIIKRQYTYDKNIKVGHMILFERGKAPDWLKGEVMEYFEGKSKLKHSDPYLYGRYKAFLNSIYGMTATAPVRQTFDLGDDLIIKLSDKVDKESQKKALEKYYRSYNSFMPYQFAIYTTAFARKALFDMIEIVGYENFLYCDTDSVFYIETPENALRMAEFTQKCKDRAIQGGAYVGENFLGLPTDEPPIRAFRGLHSKCYAMEEMNEDGDYELKVTIAGIPKSAIKFVDGKPVKMTNAQELGDIDNLVDGFKFKHCGGTRAIYNERPIETITIQDHKIELASNVIIDTIEKEISDTMWTHDEFGNLQNILYTDCTI